MARRTESPDQARQSPGPPGRAAGGIGIVHVDVLRPCRCDLFVISAVVEGDASQIDSPAIRTRHRARIVDVPQRPPDVFAVTAHQRSPCYLLRAGASGASQLQTLSQQRAALASAGNRP